MSDNERLEDNTSPSIETEQNAEGVRPNRSEREVYFQALRLWIQHAQLCQNLKTCFPYYMMSLQGFQNQPTNIPLLNNNYQFQGQQFPFQIPFPPRPPTENRPAADPQTPADVIARHGGYEYIIPPLYKRLIAEFLDFILLFILKLSVTFIAVDMFELINVDKFDFYKFSENYKDYKFAMELTSEILLLEIIYRILVCIFEAIFLSGSVGRTGGATPGKALLGLRVITASAVIAVEGRPKETVLIYPGKPPSFFLALLRSLIKNFLISLLFPLCVMLFIFRFNRTGYDLICGVIVVEENMFPPRRHAP